MTRPTREQIRLLRPLERFAYRFANLMAGPLKFLSKAWNLSVVAFIAWLAIGRRIRIHGLENLEGISRKSRVLLVSNHRSFFDFFAIGAVCAYRTKLPRRSFFPVRATFFYDRVLGVIVNLLLAGMSMFPPILRDRSRLSFNRFAMGRVVAELARPGTLVGMHPEGTRNKGPDPYVFLRAKPGTGKVALEAPEGTLVVPVFILGMSNAVHKEMFWNFTAAPRHPINLFFGPNVPLDDLRAEGSRPTTQKLAADRCLEAIADLSEKERRLRAEEGAAPPPPAERPEDVGDAAPADGARPPPEPPAPEA